MRTSSHKSTKRSAVSRSEGQEVAAERWDTLAGDENGEPLEREGITFPVLRVAQVRQGKPVTPNAIWLSENEEPPDVIATKRWPRRRLPAPRKRTARRTPASHARAS